VTTLQAYVLLQHTDSLFLNLITELSLNRREGVETEIQNGREDLDRRPCT
jgi:hypothetical protein